MAEVALVPNTIVRTGVEPTNNTGLSAANTYTVENPNGNTVLRIKNGGAEATKLTVTTQQQVDEESVTNREVEVGAGKTKYVGPYPQSMYNKKGSFDFTLSKVTSVEVEVVQF